MNWAAVSTVTVLLFLFGVGLQSSWQLEGLLNQFGSQLEVSVYLDTGVPADALKPQIEKLSQVASVTAVSKEEAWANLVKELGVSNLKDATQQLEGNPLVDELKVKATKPEAVPILAQQLSAFQGVDKVQYVDEAVKQVSQLNRGLSWVSLGITSLLTMTAVAVITTTIRLIVMARHREIEVMQLVGATTTWIYLPFILQGILFGAVGAGVAWGLLLGLQQSIAQFMAQQPEFVQVIANGLRLSPMEWLLLPLILLGFGASVGLMGSLFAVRKVALK